MTMKTARTEYWIKMTRNNETACQFHAIDNGEVTTLVAGFGRVLGSVVLSAELSKDDVDSLIEWLTKWRGRMEGDE